MVRYEEKLKGNTSFYWSIFISHQVWVLLLRICNLVWSKNAFFLLPSHNPQESERAFVRELMSLCSSIVSGVGFCFVCLVARKI